jgi:hypothetical protein
MALLKLRFSKSARKHRIGKARVIYVLENNKPEFIFTEEVIQVWWLAPDNRGVELEILAILEDDVICVIHVMPSRCRKGKKWPK